MQNIQRHRMKSFGFSLNKYRSSSEYKTTSLLKSQREKHQNYAIFPLYPWPAKKYSLFLRQHQIKKKIEKIALKFPPRSYPLFWAKDLKRNPVPVHVCKWEHVSVFQPLCECVALCALAFLWHFNFMLSNSRLKGESQVLGKVWPRPWWPLCRGYWMWVRLLTAAIEFINCLIMMIRFAIYHQACTFSHWYLNGYSQLCSIKFFRQLTNLY